MQDTLEIVEEEWANVVDDIDRYGLTDNAVPLVPLSQLHRADPSFGLATVTDAAGEETKESDKMQLIVQMVPAFGLKELSVYVDADQLV